MSAESTITYARGYLGVWYRWGGKARFGGLDCSGFVCDLLRHDSVVLLKGNYCAQDLYEVLLKRPGSTVQKAPFPKACVLFFGHNTDQIDHCALSSDKVHMIECAGGTSSTTTFDRAVDLNAGVREVPIATRLNLVMAILPKYLDA